MRPLDLVLGALGLTALGLMLSSVPAVEAASPVDAALSAAAATAGSASESASESASGASSGAVPEIELETAPERDSDRRVQCCRGSGLTPAEREARVRTLRRVLAPTGSDAATMLERMRLDLLLQREAALTRQEEREVS